MMRRIWQRSASGQPTPLTFVLLVLPRTPVANLSAVAYPIARGLCGYYPEACRLFRSRPRSEEFHAIV